MDKTFIGGIARGFDFLGYWFLPAGLGVAPKTVERFVERVSKAYEQGAVFARIGEYVRHGWLWVRWGVDMVLCGGERFFWGFAGELLQARLQDGDRFVEMGGYAAEYASDKHRRSLFFLLGGCVN